MNKFQYQKNKFQPIQLYAATKLSNEMMAYTYSSLYKIKTTGLRFLLYMDHGEDPICSYLNF